MRTGTRLMLVVAAGLLSSCQSSVGVKETGFVPVYEELRRNVLDEGSQPSVQTRQVLAYFDLDERYRDDPAGAIEELQGIAERARLRALHVIVAELHYALAAARDGDRGHFFAAAVYAYTYLFGEGFEQEPNPYSPIFRMACDLYNRGLARALLDDSGAVVFEDGVYDTPLGRVALETSRAGFPWGPESFSTFLPADAFEVRGLRERVRKHGLGVPLIAVRSPDAQDDLVSRHIGRALGLPATAFLRLDAGLAELERSGTLTATLELYLDSNSPGILVGEGLVPLETDITVPLAYGLEGSPIWKFKLDGFLHGDTEEFTPGIYMIQPYQPDKIPLVLVHGTFSSPATWAQTVNGLMADPRVRSRYQVWLGMYNTGSPIPYSAMQLRESMVDLVQEIDPEGDDPLLRDMVLVGHSQGGLVCRLLLTESGDRIWNSISDESFEEHEMKGKARDLLGRALFFEPLPYFDSVVFISTPHRGSFFATSWIGRLGARLIKLPRSIVDLSKEMLGTDEVPRELRRLNSVSEMKPDSNFNRVLATLPWKQDLKIHTIAAVKPSFSTIEGGNDGVVAYTSAHLEDAHSEVVVRHGHSCQGEPATIVRLDHILTEHLGADPPAAESPR